MTLLCPMGREQPCPVHFRVMPFLKRQLLALRAFPHLPQAGSSGRWHRGEAETPGDHSSYLCLASADAPWRP